MAGQATDIVQVAQSIRAQLNELIDSQEKPDAEVKTRKLLLELAYQVEQLAAIVAAMKKAG